jgi:hypothetical protein
VFQEEREEGRSSFNVFKLAGTLGGFVSLTALSSLLTVTSTIVPALMPSTVTLVIVGSAVSGIGAILSARFNDPLRMVLCASSTIALLLGGFLGGREALFGWLMTLTIGSASGIVIPMTIAIILFAIALYFVFGTMRSDR